MNVIVEIKNGKSVDVQSRSEFMSTYLWFASAPLKPIDLDGKRQEGYSMFSALAEMLSLIKIIVHFRLNCFQK